MANPAHANASGTELHEAKRTKQPARAGSTANVTISAPGTTLDGVTLANGDRILLKDQSTASQNGLYVFNGSAVAATRASDATAASDFVFGFQVYVREGTVNAASIWVFTQSAAVTVGTTAITFVKLFIGAALADPTTTRGDLITRGASALIRLALGAAGKFLGSDGTDTVWTNSAQFYAATGLTGATAAARFVGGTVSGAPASGTFAVGDFVIDQAGKVWVCTGAGTPGTWAQSGGGMANPMTTNQDVIVGGASGSPTRLAIGGNGQVLTVSAGSVAWLNSASGFSNPMTQPGDLIEGGTGGAGQRLAVGGNGQILTVVGGVPGWANNTGGTSIGANAVASTNLYLATHCI